MAVQAPDRAAEGYSKEVFGSTDCTTVPQGVAITGPQLTGTGGGGVVVNGAAVVELFTAILMELRQMNAILLSMQRGSAAENAELLHM